MTACACNQPPRPKHNYMRPFGSKSDGKALQLVQSDRLRLQPTTPTKT
nr:MAG TPA: hypothetical protein [Caudoviricetes sp.]